MPGDAVVRAILRNLPRYSNLHTRPLRLWSDGLRYLERSPCLCRVRTKRDLVDRDRHPHQSHVHSVTVPIAEAERERLGFRGWDRQRHRGALPVSVAQPVTVADRQRLTFTFARFVAFVFTVTASDRFAVRGSFAVALARSDLYGIDREYPHPQGAPANPPDCRVPRHVTS